MVVTLCELKWLRGLLHDLRVPVNHPILLHCDNQAAIYIAGNTIFHERMKHIEINCHFVQDAFQPSFIVPSYIHSDSQPVDILTKTLLPSHFHYLTRKLGIHDIHVST